MKNCILFLSIAILVGANACDNNDNGEKYVYFSEYILSAEVTNKQTRNIVINNTGRKISFEMLNTETLTDVNIKLTLAKGVSMASKQEDDYYDLSASAEIRLSAGGSVVVFNLSVTFFEPEKEPVPELILAAEVTNRHTRNMVVNNNAGEITFDIAQNEPKSGVNIKLTLADGVTMVSPATSQVDYDLTLDAKIIVSYNEQNVEYTVTASEFVSTAALLAQKGWTQQTQFGQLKEGIRVYRYGGSFNGKNVIAYIALGNVDVGINFHVLTANYDETARQAHGVKTPTQFYNENNGEFQIVMNGTFWWWDGNNQRNRNTGLIHRNGVMIEPTPRTVTRNGLTYHVTRGVFSELANKQYRTDWAYTTHVNNRTTYAYPRPLDNKLGQPPLPTPTANNPAGGWLYSAPTAIGGGPLLIKNGIVENNWEAELFDQASTIEPFTSQPRTAIGFTTDRDILFFVCEGRNVTPSVPGLTLQEVAELLLEIGCVELLNLDGGGSSCMLVNGTTTIIPSDPINVGGVQRAVVTAIGLK